MLHGNLSEAIDVIYVFAAAVSGACAVTLMLWLVYVVYAAILKRIGRQPANPPIEGSRRRSFTRIGALAWGAFLYPAVFLAQMTVFLFVGPGAMESRVTPLFAAGFWLLPLVCLAALIGGLLCSRASASRTASRIGVRLVCAPLLNAAFIIVMLVVWSAIG